MYFWLRAEIASHLAKPVSVNNFTIEDRPVSKAAMFQIIMKLQKERWILIFETHGTAGT